MVSILPSDRSGLDILGRYLGYCNATKKEHGYSTTIWS
jgi:hypothetical protein